MQCCRILIFEYLLIDTSLAYRAVVKAPRDSCLSFAKKSCSIFLLTLAGTKSGWLFLWIAGLRMNMIFCGGGGVLYFSMNGWCAFINAYSGMSAHALQLIALCLRFSLVGSSCQFPRLNFSLYFFLPCSRPSNLFLVSLQGKIVIEWCLSLQLQLQSAYW